MNRNRKKKKDSSDEDNTTKRDMLSGKIATLVFDESVEIAPQ